MLIADVISPYGLIYLTGVLLLYLMWRGGLKLRAGETFAAVCVSAVLTIAGARAGYVLCYEPDYFSAHPLEIFALYQGGMSFHGALIGFILALPLTFKDRSLRLKAADLTAWAALLLLPLGRVMNYLGGEIYGTEAAPGTPFAAVYPALDLKLRHAVTLYEAALYLIVLLPMLLILKKLGALKFHGAFAAAFLTLQALLRFTVDFWRLPDLSTGYILGPLALGQLLSLVQLAAGVLIFLRLRRRAP